MNTPPVLEVRVHPEGGHVTKFVQNDPLVAGQILESIKPNRMFSSPQLLIGSDHVLTAFQPGLIVRIDLITELVPSWSTLPVALDTQEITQEQFETRCHPGRDVQRLPSREIVVFGVWEMVNGERVFLQTHMTGFEKKKLPMDAGMFIQQLMTSTELLARGREAGYVVLNPARMLRFTSYVGLQEMPANALPMRQLAEPALNDASFAYQGS